jgi:hypothetical protein
MKKIVFILSAIVLASCSKSKTDEAVVVVAPPVVVVEKKLSFKIINPPTTERLMNNIQVGEVIFFNVEIIDEENAPNTTYMLSPVSSPTDGLKKHQNNNIDFNFNSSAYFKGTGDKNGFVKELSLTDKVASFGVKVLKPGNFQNVYQIQKMVDNKPVGKPLTQDLLFSAVRITAETPYTQTKNPTLFRSSEWRREYYFRIDCGDQEFDNYTLPSVTKKSVTYETSYQGNKWTAGLNSTSNEKNIIRTEDNTESGPAQCSYNLDSAKIIIEYTNGDKNIIEYKNIPLTEFRF